MPPFLLFACLLKRIILRTDFLPDAFTICAVTATESVVWRS